MCFYEGNDLGLQAWFPLVDSDEDVERVLSLLVFVGLCEVCAVDDFEQLVCKVTMLAADIPYKEAVLYDRVVIG